MKVVGRRTDRPARLADANALQDLLELRRSPYLVPRGVYRFRSFEEADRWMIQTTADTYASLGLKTSSASAAR
jgi:hypothetical protein